MTHIPKGSMCLVCNNRTSKTCGSLDFAAMQPLKKYPDGTVAVKCEKFSKELRQSVIDEFGFAEADIDYMIEKRVLGAKSVASFESRARLNMLIQGLV